LERGAGGSTTGTRFINMERDVDVDDVDVDEKGRCISSSLLVGAK
jgi:hypothetical protein